MADQAKSNRKRLVFRIRRKLETASSPRLQMSAIVFATAAVGFFTSSTALWLGLRTIWLRYALAVVVAYVAFLVFLKLWLRLSRRLGRPKSQVVDPTPYHPVDLTPLETTPYRSRSSFNIFEADEEGCLLLIIAAAVILVVSASLGFVVVTAPSLFAELMLDAALSAGLYRRVGRLHRRHWLASAFRHTWAVFAVTLCACALLGVAMTNYEPTAVSLGDVWRKLTGG